MKIYFLKLFLNILFLKKFELQYFKVSLILHVCILFHTVIWYSFLSPLFFILWNSTSCLIQQEICLLVLVELDSCLPLTDRLVKRCHCIDATNPPPPRPRPPRVQTDRGRRSWRTNQSCDTGTGGVRGAVFCPSRSRNIPRNIPEGIRIIRQISSLN